MKNYTFITLTIAIMLASTLFINIGNATNQTTYTIQTNGTININNSNQLTVVLRCLTLTMISPDQNLVDYVDNFVGNYSFAENMIILLSDLGIDGILRYPNEFNETNGSWPINSGWTWTKIKTLIDAFHANGWKVWWSGTAVAWDNQWLYNYISNKHPELSFTDAYGYRANDAISKDPKGNLEGNKEVGYNCLIPNFWANYSTSDMELGIKNNTRLIDVITTKLGQLISSGLQFDGWSGSDGWNGFNIQGYYFKNINPSNYYSFSYQSENEWESDSQSGYGLSRIGKPLKWDNWNITQRANWIISDSSASELWHEWWCYRFAEMYLQIKNAIVNNNPNPQKYYSAIGADTSSQWTTGNLGGAGLLNFTMIADIGSIDIFNIDPEDTYTTPEYVGMPKTESYVAALIKGKDSRLTCGIGIQETSYGDGVIAVPEWNLRQQYLAQVQNYVWYNGSRIPAADRTTFFIQFVPENIPGNINWTTSTWNNTATHNFFKWISQVNTLFTEGVPLYLGPTKVNGYYLWGADGVNGISYTFAQWTDQNNLQKSTTYINTQMDTIFLEQSDFMNSHLPNSFQELIFSIFKDKSLNLIIGNARGNGAGGGPIATSIFSSGIEEQVEYILNLNYSEGKKNQSASIIDQKYINDPIGKWIASNHDSSSEWLCPNIDYAYCYKYCTELIPIALSSDGRVVLGILNSQEYSNFLYMCLYSKGFTGSPQFGETIPREVVNRAIYWASNSPLNSTNSLLDYKVFKTSNSIVIPIINQSPDDSILKKMPVTSILDLSKLGLEPQKKYVAFWSSSPNEKIDVTDFTKLSITLKNGADILLIINE